MSAGAGASERPATAAGVQAHSNTSTVDGALTARWRIPARIQSRCLMPLHQRWDSRTRWHMAAWLLRGAKVAAGGIPDGVRDGAHAAAGQLEAGAGAPTCGDDARSNHHTPSAAVERAGAEEGSLHSRSADREPEQEVVGGGEAGAAEQSSGAAVDDARRGHTPFAQADQEEAKTE